MHHRIARLATRLEIVRVVLIDAGDVGGERAIDVNRQQGQDAGPHPFLKVMDDNLGSAETKSGNQHLAAAGHGAADRLPQLVRHVFDGLVPPAAVGAFADQQVAGGHRARLAQERQAAPAQVAGEGNTVLRGRPCPSVNWTMAEPRICPASTKRSRADVLMSSGCS